MLLPVCGAEQRAPVGIFDLEIGVDVEGGNVGQITRSVSSDTKPVVRLFDPADADGYGADGYGTESSVGLNLVGLIDDSTTGSGYGTLFGSLQSGTKQSVLIGPDTTRASGKCTLWIEGGMYITDQFTGDIDTDTPVGTELRSIDGVLSDENDGTVIVGKVLKVVTGGLSSITDLFGVIAPRVQPLPASTTLMLFKFK